MSALDPEKGIEDLVRTLYAARRPLDTVNDNFAKRFVRELGWHGFLWIIRQRLDTIYPAPIFRAVQHGVLWSSEHGGEDIDPGIKWATLLDMALQELEPK